MKTSRKIAIVIVLLNLTIWSLIEFNNFTREFMSNVKDELKRNHLEASYYDFLGFLVNEVNFPLKESVELLNWKQRYFVR